MHIEKDCLILYNQHEENTKEKAMNKSEYLRIIDKVIEEGRYKADWTSLAHRKTPDRLTEGKLGFFIHWGIYSVPGYGNKAELKIHIPDSVNSDLPLCFKN